MNRNDDDHRRYCISVARISSLVMTITKLQAFIVKVFEFIIIIGVMALAAGAAHAASEEVIKLGDRVESIREKSRAVDEFVQQAASGIELQLSQFPDRHHR